MALYRVVTVFTGVQGSPWYNTLFFRETGGTAAQAAAAAGTFWATVDGRMATNVLWSQEPDVAEIDETTGDLIGLSTVTPAGGAGSGSATMLPIVTQGLVQLRTGTFFNGRELRGRIFIPGLTENDNDLGIPNSGILAAVNAAAAALIADANSVLEVYSRANNTAADVSTAVMSSSWSYLKTRRD